MIDDLVNRVIPNIPDGELHNVLRRNGTDAIGAVQRASVGNENQTFRVVVTVEGYQVEKIIAKEKLVERRSHHSKPTVKS